MQDLEAGIDELYAGPLDAFIRDRDALAKARADGGDAAGAALVRGLRKPVVSAWALNRLARERPDEVRELADLGERLRAAQRRAVSGGDVEPLRDAIEERRRQVSSLARLAAGLLQDAGTAPGPHVADLTSTLEAAAADEEAAALLRSGRVIKALRPPADFAEQGLRVLQGGRRGGQGPIEAKRERPSVAEAERVSELRRELAAAERREHAAAISVERAGKRLRELDAKRTDVREALKAAEAEHRGAALGAKRLRAALSKLGS